MAEYFELGEVKVRPGGYFNIQKSGGNPIPGVVNGVTAVIFKSDFGPLNQVVEFTAEEGYADIFGTGGTTDAIQYAINGGAKDLVAVRLGTTERRPLLRSKTPRRKQARTPSRLRQNIRAIWNSP